MVNTLNFSLYEVTLQSMELGFKPKNYDTRIRMPIIPNNLSTP